MWQVVEVDAQTQVATVVSTWYEYGVAQGQARLLNRIEANPDRYNYRVTYDVNDVPRTLSVLHPVA